MITPDLINNAIKSIEYNRIRGTNSVVCALVLHNGHIVIGEAHCAPDTEFNAELGMKYSREDAERKVGELLTFAARERSNPLLS